MHGSVYWNEYDSSLRYEEITHREVLQRGSCDDGSWRIQPHGLGKHLFCVVKVWNMRCHNVTALRDLFNFVDDAGFTFRVSSQQIESPSKAEGSRFVPCRDEGHKIVDDFDVCHLSPRLRSAAEISIETRSSDPELSSLRFSRTVVRLERRNSTAFIARRRPG